ncbi:hypothetical protein F8M41_009630 [Gigaspora margarita]|uniref:Uncharacterized protein n=1 Tax=Gigaspora margarita TaxID=4874 RepID=A0A8H4A301_GIGMA|nr:hypothetical protein F8M41_009630 [Gigaspora margarita]
MLMIFSGSGLLLGIWGVVFGSLINACIVLSYHYEEVSWDESISTKLKCWFNFLIALILVICPAIISGYLFSTNPISTKIAFAICSIALSRLYEHYSDNEPKKLVTATSYFLNFNSIMCDKKKICDELEDLIECLEVITDHVELKAKNVINSVKNSLESQLEMISGRMLKKLT